MVKLILGSKGQGKTKLLIARANAAAETSDGNVVCVDKYGKLELNVNNAVRLVQTDEYNIMGYEELYGFLTGICAGNYDITDVFVDATLRIGGRDLDLSELATFLGRMEKLSKISETNFVFTISENKDNLPEAVLAFSEAE
ncbi:MAG: hypothetical protein LBJ12_08105 [Oscillospiraceae bacterium]|jgi:hypothetical protein|nr:hypothetical protein [Oscillospiraceae bacterium]